jgi:ribonuclease J
MSTGSQGEPMSALGRMANGDHRHITIESGDTVVLASSLVPGNETSVYRVINRLSRAGATVIHKETAKVHVSGHAPAGELLFLLNVVRPSNLMPVHGEWRHLRAHAQLGVESGVATR